jgi:hypothetical protein
VKFPKPDFGHTSSPNEGDGEDLEDLGQSRVLTLLQLSEAVARVKPFRGWVDVVNKFGSVIIESPRDVLYPFGRKVFENIEIYYHGTSSTYIERIEERGFTTDDLTYSVEDVRRLCESYDSVCFPGFSAGGIGVLKSFTLGALDSQESDLMPVSFDWCYWSARRFSCNAGGETIAHMIKAGYEYEELVEDPERRQEHRENLSNKLAHPALAPGPNLNLRDRYVACLERLSDEAHLRNQLEQVLEIRNKYLEITKDAYPVVYAVKLRPEWIESEGQYSRKTLTLDLRYEDDPLEVRIRAGTIVPASSIIGRADFVNGADRWTSNDDEIVPLPWLLEGDQRGAAWNQGFFI